MVDNSTQTPIPTNNFSVKISIKYGGQEKTRIIHDKVEQNVVKGFFNKSSKSAVLKHLLQNDKYKREAISCIGRYVKDEVNNLCRHEGSLLKATSETILLMASFDWTKIAEEMKLKLPTLMGVLSCIYESKQTPNIMRLVTAISVLLYNRSQYINLIQILFGIVFASYGLRKEGIKILHNIGLSASYATIREKKKLFNTAYEENVTDVMDTYKEFRIKLENEMFDDNNGNNYTDNNSDILTTGKERSELVNVKQENETVSDNSDTFPTDLENIAVGKVKQENETESDNSDVHVLTAKTDKESINNDTVAMEIKHEPLIGQEYDLNNASSSV